MISSVPEFLAILTQNGVKIKDATAYIPTIIPAVVPLTPFSSKENGVYM